MERYKLVKFIALWNKESNAGILYQSGVVSMDITLKKGDKVVLFTNREKRSDKSPDYTLSVEDKSAPLGQREEQPSGSRKVNPPPSNFGGGEDDGTPF
jgi:hypothetical protein